MIVRKDKSFVKLELYPDSDWLGDADWVLDDNTQQELEEKIASLYPNFNFVTDEKGQLIDVTATEPTPEPAPEPTLEERLAEQEATIATLEEKITELGTYNETLTECVLEMSEYVYQ